MLAFILGGWLVSGTGLGFLIGRVVSKADEIELGDVDDYDLC